MKAKLKKAIRRVVLGYRASSDDYIAHLRRYGAKIGEKCYIYAPNHTVIDTTNPYMITIGDGVLMTGPVTILTHDYSTHIYNVKHNMELATLRPVSIGNNVFFGVGLYHFGRNDHWRQCDHWRQFRREWKCRSKFRVCRQPGKTNHVY